MLNEYPKTNAKPIESMTLGAAVISTVVAIIMPSTSPIAQPVRQCKVAANAVLFSSLIMYAV
jgi:hypothetical protein